MKMLTELIEKDHTSVEEVLEDFYEAVNNELYILEDDPAMPGAVNNNPSNQQQPNLQGPQLGMNPAPDPNQQPQNNDDLMDLMNSNNAPNQPPPNPQDFKNASDMTGMNMGLGGPEEDPALKTEKTRLVSNLKELSKLRDILDELVSRTSDSRFNKFRYLTTRVLSTVVNTGSGILNRNDLQKINDKMEFFINQTTANCVTIIKHDYHKANNNQS